VLYTTWFMCVKELLAESERAVGATVPHGRGLQQAASELR
jgi:hypothetical protein